MTTTLTIPPGDRGTVRLFAVDLPSDEAAAFADDPGAIARALGAPDLDPGHVDVFPVSRVSALGLRAFLSEGHGIPPEALVADAAQIDALGGHVVVASSGAFGPEERSLHVGPPLRLVGAWREDLAPVTFNTLPSGGAEGVLGGQAAPPPPAPGSGGGMRRVLTVLLLILAIIGFIVLNGGQ
jgi:hypothetical protein